MTMIRTFHVCLIAALIAGATVATPSFASKNERHGENHSEGYDDDHGKGHDDDHGKGYDDDHGKGHDDDRGRGYDDNRSGGGKSGGGTVGGGNTGGGNTTRMTLRTRLTGTLQAGAYGEVKLEPKPRRTQFEAEVKLPIPSAALDVADKAGAQAAVLTLTLGRAGAAYAECDFDLKSIKSNRKRGTASAEYKIEINSRNGTLQERFGACDTDLATPGFQAGVPAVQAGDSAEVSIDTTGDVFLDGTF
jgi:hypothetical protein